MKEGTMFGNPYGENDYNIPGHEEDERLNERLKAAGKDFVPAEEIPDQESESDEKEVQEASRDEVNFLDIARKKLTASEFDTLSIFLQNMDEEGTRSEYFGKQDGAEFIPPVKSIPEAITNLVKKVNAAQPMVESLKNNFDEQGNYIDSTIEKVTASSIKSKDSKK